jgi:hypothetical protein
VLAVEEDGEKRTLRVVMDADADRAVAYFTG